MNPRVDQIRNLLSGWTPRTSPPNRPPNPRPASGNDKCRADANVRASRKVSENLRQRLLLLFKDLREDMSCSRVAGKHTNPPYLDILKHVQQMWEECSRSMCRD